MLINSKKHTQKNNKLKTNMHKKVQANQVAG